MENINGDCKVFANGSTHYPKFAAAFKGGKQGAKPRAYLPHASSAGRPCSRHWSFAWMVLVVGILSFTGAVRGQGTLDLTKFDTTKYFHFSNVKLSFDTTWYNNEPVATIDTANNIKIPAGWEWVMVIKNGEAWAFDSSKTLRSVSHPEYFKRRQRRNNGY